jgi:hypothetical protein
MSVVNKIKNHLYTLADLRKTKCARVRAEVSRAVEREEEE